MDGLLHGCSSDSKGKQRGGYTSVPARIHVSRLLSSSCQPASCSLCGSGQCQVLPGTPPVLLASVVQ